MRVLRVGCAIPGLLLACPALAQEDPARKADSQLWTVQNVAIPIEDGLGLALDSTQRFGDAANGIYEAQFGFNLTYQLSKAVQLAGGYAHTTSYREGPNRQENRLRQQATVKFGMFSARWRIEERFRNDGTDMGWRTRLQLKAGQPFRKGGDLQWVLSHESFVSLNDTDWGQVSGYNRMRNYAGLRMPLTDTLGIEAGYMNQYDFKPGADAIANIAQVTLSLNL